MAEFNPVYKRLAGTGLYTGDMNAPLAEQADNVVQFELTAGCSHAGCTYCDLYGEQRYSVKDLDGFLWHAINVMDTLNQRGELEGLERVFIGNGDALSVPTLDLMLAIEGSIQLFREYVGKLPKRIAMYASVKNVVDKGANDLRTLFCGGTSREDCSIARHGEKIGLEMIYLGLETGSDKLLRIAGKPYNRYDVNRASWTLQNAKVGHGGIAVSAFVMPGLGGVAHWGEHVRETVGVLQSLRPEFLNFMPVHAMPGTPYARWMEQEVAKGYNRPLTADELTQQMIDIIDFLNFDVSFGSFDNSSYLGEDTTPIKFPTVKLKRGNRFRKNRLVEVLTKALEGSEREISPEVIEALNNDRAFPLR